MRHLRFLLGVLSIVLTRAMGIFGDQGADPIVSVIMVAAVILPLALRRRFPSVVAVVVAAGFVVGGELRVEETLVINLALFCAIYTVGAWEADRRVKLDKKGDIRVQLNTPTYKVEGEVVSVTFEQRYQSGNYSDTGRKQLEWVKEGGDLFETMAFLDSVGCSRYVVTDVARDGMMSGPNIDLLREVAERTDAKVTASGGISKLDDLRAIKELADLGVDSAILGKSLYARAFTLEEALEVAR